VGAMLCHLEHLLWGNTIFSRRKYISSCKQSICKLFLGTPSAPCCRRPALLMRHPTGA
jgi:hypothetical protein